MVLFTGFIVQARDAESDKVMGYFVPSQYSLMDCSGLKASTVWIKGGLIKSEVALKWMIPKGMAKDQKIAFRATAMDETGKSYMLMETISNLI
jgi:hypothetical protein